MLLADYFNKGCYNISNKLKNRGLFELLIRIFAFIAMVYFEYKFFAMIDDYIYPNLPLELLLIVPFLIVVFVTYLKVFPEKKKYKNY